MKRTVLSILIVFGALSLGGAAEKPNILLIVADDLGYRDTGFQGATEIPTPNLDKLAARSVRCRNGYVSHPFCSPTRAGLSTGRYQHRFGHENNPAWLPEDTKAGLPVDQITLAQVLGENGYATAHVGKWHLGAHPQFHPMRRGLKESFAALGGGHLYFAGDKGGAEYAIPLNRNGLDEPQKGYLTDQFGDEAAAAVSRHAPGGPWFLYLAFNAPHTPLRAPEEWEAKFAGIADVNRRTYAAMVAAMDANIGKVLDAVEASGEQENTLVYFVSDNGGPNLAAKGGAMTNFTDNAPLRGAKGQVYEGGIRVPFLVSWPAQLTPGEYEEPVIALDFFATSVAAAEGVMPGDRVMDSVNLIPYLRGEVKSAPHEMLFWRSQGANGLHAARKGKWKLVSLPGQPLELYDLTQDAGETRNLAAAEPELTAQLQAAIADWEKEMIDPVFEGPKPGRKRPK